MVELLFGSYERIARCGLRSLICINAPAAPKPHHFLMWQPITTAPFDRELLAVMDKDEPHALVFPCCRIPGGWVNAGTKRWLDVRPTHWREWAEKP